MVNANIPIWSSVTFTCDADRKWRSVLEDLSLMCKPGNQTARRTHTLIHTYTYTHIHTNTLHIRSECEVYFSSSLWQTHKNHLWIWEDTWRQRSSCWHRPLASVIKYRRHTIRGCGDRRALDSDCSSWTECQVKQHHPGGRAGVDLYTACVDVLTQTLMSADSRGSH